MSKNHSRTVSIDTPSHSSRGRTPEGEPNPVDVYVGSRLRLRRTVLNLSQEKLAALAGLTFQQIQKYEHGMNRIGAEPSVRFCADSRCAGQFLFCRNAGRGRAAQPAPLQRRQLL